MSPATSTNTVNLVQKSQLARLLATENMTIEHSQSAKTASFDTNTRKLILPIWSKGMRPFLCCARLPATS